MVLILHSVNFLVRCKLDLSCMHGNHDSMKNYEHPIENWDRIRLTLQKRALRK